MYNTEHRVNQLGVGKGEGGTISDAEYDGSRAVHLALLLLIEHTNVLLKILARRSRQATSKPRLRVFYI